MNDTVLIEETTIDFLMTADFAEVVQGKVYMMGAGWDKFAPLAYPAVMRIGLAAGIRVPYLESNVPHHLSVTLRSGDGADLFKIDGDLETGRPAGSRGESILVPLAVNAQVNVAGPQLMELVAEVDGRAMRRMSIRAVGTP
jgi:hypothetical protein